MKLSYARIVTADVAALARFYREVTAIAPDIKSDDYVEFRTQGGALAISSQRTMDLYGAGATRPAENRSAIIEFQVDDVDAERVRLRELVPTCVLEPTLQPWGNRSMLFRDPDGNLINFFTPQPGRAAPPSVEGRRP
jgi:catechol 2,3-dioxygenase-like lactoylglutathione lyase family enzyme